VVPWSGNITGNKSDVIFYLYFAQLERDAGRLIDCRERVNFCPLGACALAGTGLPIDRFKTAKDLNFTAPMKNR
jgi:argininosuccinate lyase